jgi:hypothetical protein
MPPPDNSFLATRLREAADLLEQQGANPFRVRAYRRAADTVERWPDDVTELALREGQEGLVALPGVGRAIAGGLIEMAKTGRWSQLERMRGTMDPEQVFRTLPGVGEALAHQIHDVLHADSLVELEIAAHDGRLAQVPGVGPQRVAMIRASLAERLGRAHPHSRPSVGTASHPAHDPPVPPDEPGVSDLLDVDAEYLRGSAAGCLPRIAPRRFNPGGEAWLPILHTQRGPWHFTALFSNTPRAHRLDRTRDWVVVYFHSDHEPEGQRTVVTETQGPLAGRRVVRGREVECRASDEASQPEASST